MKGYSLGLMGLQDSRFPSFPKIENSDLGIIAHTYNSLEGGDEKMAGSVQEYSSSSSNQIFKDTYILASVKTTQ